MRLLQVQRQEGGADPRPSEHDAHSEAAASQGRPKPKTSSWASAIPFLEGLLEQRVLERRTPRELNRRRQFGLSGGSDVVW